MYPIVVISWLDAVSRDEWTHLSDPLPPTPIMSAGYLINESADHYTIAVNIDVSNNNSSCTMTIPKGMVTNVEVVKEHIQEKPKRRRTKRTTK